MAAILYYLSISLGTLGGLMLPTAMVAFSAGDLELGEGFLLTSGLTGFLSGGVYFALRGQEKELVNHQSILLCVLVWFGLPVAGAFPFVLSGALTGVDAYFEAASGLSTTGATVFPSLADVPKAIIFWRAVLQWLGGFLSLLTFLMILAPSGIGSMYEGQQSLMERNLGDDRGRTFYVIRQVAAAYILVTVILGWLLSVSGIPTFDAVCLAFASISTGGFLPADGTLGDYGNWLAEILIALGMLIGATSILWHRMVVRGKAQFFMQYRENYILLLLVLLLGLTYSIIMFQLAGSASVLSPASALRQGFFTAISLVSTSGFEMRHADVTVLPAMLVIGIAFIGATPFSTAGGLKLYRIGALCIHLIGEAGRLSQPNMIRGGKLGRVRVSIQFMKSVWATMILSIILIAIVTGIVTVDIGNLPGGLIATIASFSNIGPLYTAGWSPVGDWPGYHQMSSLVKYTLAITMILGRIEIVILLGALNFKFWRS